MGGGTIFILIIYINIFMTAYTSDWEIYLKNQWMLIYLNLQLEKNVD